MKLPRKTPALAFVAVTMAAGCSSSAEPTAQVAPGDATQAEVIQATDLTGISFEVFRDPG